MYRLIRDNVVKLTDDPVKRDRLISEGFRWDKEEEKSPKGKAADDGNGKRSEKP